jgi:DNA-binding LytR/AlgR family response regulator
MSNSKLTALIVDDEHSGRSSLKILLNKNCSYLFDKVVTASSLAEAIQQAENEHFNICFLDINLNNQSGFDLIPYLSSETKIVFVTAYSEFAIKAIKENAFDYLLKPINPAEFKLCVDRYEKEISDSGGVKRYLHIKDQGATIPIQLDEIEFLQAEGAYSKIHLTKNREYITAKTLKSMTDVLGKDFIRIHKSYIINKAMVKSFKKNSLTTIHNTCLPVSRVGAKELSSHF